MRAPAVWKAGESWYHRVQSVPCHGQRGGSSLDHRAAGNLKCIRRARLCIGFVLVHDCSMFAKVREGRLQEDIRLTACVVAARRKTSGLRPGVVRKVDNDRLRRAAHDHPSKRLQFRTVDFHVRQESGDMNEIAGLCTRDRFASFTPPNFADAGEDVGDGLLFSMMMNSSPRSGSTRTGRPRLPMQCRAPAR